jgi:hypothetical protein
VCRQIFIFTFSIWGAYFQKFSFILAFRHGKKRCCPGGFSSYILNKNPRAEGVGISLPVESGGHAFLLEEHLRPRFELTLADLTRYELGYEEDGRLQPFPFPPRFDLVLLDGHPLRTATSHNAWNGDCLLMSQFIICLQSISKSGTIVVKLSKPERLVTRQLLYMLDVLSLSLACWKPVCLHATRPTFYAVAKGVGLGRQGHRASELLLQLKMLWMELTYGGTGSSGRKIANGDLDFIISDADLQRTYMSRFQQLARPIWMVQAMSLQGWYETEGLARGS